MREDIAYNEKISLFDAAKDKSTLQLASIDVWRQKYCLYDNDGQVVDGDFFDICAGIVKALSKDKQYNKELWQRTFHIKP